MNTLNMASLLGLIGYSEEVPLLQPDISWFAGDFVSFQSAIPAAGTVPASIGAVNILRGDASTPATAGQRGINDPNWLQVVNGASGQTGTPNTNSVFMFTGIRVEIDQDVGNTGGTPTTVDDVTNLLNSAQLQYTRGQSWFYPLLHAYALTTSARDQAAGAGVAPYPAEAAERGFYMLPMPIFGNIQNTQLYLNYYAAFAASRTLNFKLFLRGCVAAPDTQLGRAITTAQERACSQPAPGAQQAALLSRVLGQRAALATIGRR